MPKLKAGNKVSGEKCVCVFSGLFVWPLLHKTSMYFVRSHNYSLLFACECIFDSQIAGTVSVHMLTTSNDHSVKYSLKFYILDVLRESKLTRFYLYFLGGLMGELYQI